MLTPQEELTLKKLAKENTPMPRPVVQAQRQRSCRCRCLHPPERHWQDATYKCG